LVESATDLEAAGAQVADARRAWKQTGQVPHKDFTALSERLTRAAEAILARRDAARAERAVELRAAVETPLVEAEATLATSGDGPPAEEHGAALAAKVLAARSALRDLDGQDAAGAKALRGRVDALILRALAVAPEA